MITLFASLCVVSFLASIVHYIYSCWLERQFHLGCGYHLRRASTSAGNVAIAKHEMFQALNYAYQNGLTEGNTSIFLYYPSNDLRTWYDDLNAIYEDLRRLPDNASIAEQNIVLDAIRQRIGYYPSNIEYYPNHLAMFWATILLPTIATLSFFAAVICAIIA